MQLRSHGANKSKRSLKKVEMCRHHDNGCPFRGIGCIKDVENSCDEASRRSKIIESPCPIMLGLGYTDTSILKCSMPLLRALIPDGFKCFNGNGLCVPGQVDDERALREIEKRKPDFDLIRAAIIKSLK